MVQKEAEILIRIEERLIALDQKVERYFGDNDQGNTKRDHVISGLTTRINTHAEELRQNKTEHRWAGGIVGSLITVLVAWIEHRA